MVVVVVGPAGGMSVSVPAGGRLASTVDRPPGSWGGGGGGLGPARGRAGGGGGAGRGGRRGGERGRGFGFHRDPAGRGRGEVDQPPPDPRPGPVVARHLRPPLMEAEEGLLGQVFGDDPAADQAVGEGDERGLFGSEHL